MLYFAIHAKHQATFEVNFASSRSSHIYTSCYTGQWCDCLRQAIKSGCRFAGVDVSDPTFYLPDEDEHEQEDETSSGRDSQHNEVPQPLQDSPHLQTPTREIQHRQDAPHLQTPTRGGQTPTGGTQRRQPLQDAPHLQTPTRGGQTPTGGTQRRQPLQDAPHLQTPTRGGQTPTRRTQRRQDAPHLQTPTRGGQTPTRGTQRRQPLQDAPHLQTRTGGTQCHQDGQIPTGGIQRRQPLQDDNMPSIHQDTVLNKPTNAHLYAPYTPVAVRVAKRRRIY